MNAVYHQMTSVANRTTSNMNNLTTAPIAVSAGRVRASFNDGIGRSPNCAGLKRQLNYHSFLTWVDRIEDKRTTTDQYLMETTTAKLTAALAKLLAPTITAVQEIDLSNVPQLHNKFRDEYKRSLLTMSELKTTMLKHQLLDDFHVGILITDGDNRRNDLYNLLVSILEREVKKERGKIALNLATLDGLLHQLDREFERYQSTAEVVRNMEADQLQWADEADPDDGGDRMPGGGGEESGDLREVWVPGSDWF